MVHLIGWYLFVGAAVVLSVLIESNTFPKLGHIWVLIIWPALAIMIYRNYKNKNRI